MESVHSLGKRIKTLRNHFGLRQEEFGLRIGISANRVSEIEHNKGGTNANVLISICREFPVHPEWLLSISGEMLKEEDKTGKSESDVNVRLNMLEQQMQQVKIGNKPRKNSNTLARIPLYSNAVPAGIPDPATNEVEEYIDMPASWTLGKKNIYALKVNGDSMINIGIMTGDILLVEARETAKESQVVIATINGEVTVKTLCISKGGIVSLAPENSRYHPITITPDMDFRIQGVVLAAVRHY